MGLTCNFNCCSLISNTERLDTRVIPVNIYFDISFVTNLDIVCFAIFWYRTCFNEILVWTRSISCCYPISYMFINNSIFCVLHEFHRIVIHVFIFQTVFFDSSFVGISLFLNNNTHVWTFRHYMSKTKNMLYLLLNACIFSLKFKKVNMGNVHKLNKNEHW